MKTKQLLRRLTFLSIILLIATTSLKAQYLLNSDSAFKAGAANSGRLWGYAFGDYYYKTHADSLNRGGSNQYTGIPKDRTAFQSRRIYLGYDYNITTKFSAELLLAAEDDAPTATSSLTSAPTITSTSTSTTTVTSPTTATTTTTTTSTTTANAGNNDALQDNKLAFYIKLMNIRWKNIWIGTDLVVGQAATPAFPMITEKVWNYRESERTISDIRRTPSYDMGATLQGTFDPDTKNFGYDVMVGNGTSAKPENDNFKWFYGDVYGWFLDKKLVVDVYADYERLNWTFAWHHSRQMLKGFVAYTTAPLTIGVEGFLNNLKNDNFATTIAGPVDTLNSQASGISFYVHGDIVKDKLRFFARFDTYNPMNVVNNSLYKSYKGNTGNYNDGTPTVPAGGPNDETYKQEFLNIGLDFIPAKNVHVIPDIWYNHYATQLSGLSGAYNGDYDLVYRMTFFFTFGKDYSKQYYR